MVLKKNDFNMNEYVSKVADAHDKIKNLETRIEDIEKITTPGIILNTFKKDTELRDSLENLIWKTIKDHILIGFLWLLGGVIVIPVLTKIFSFLCLKIFGIHL